MKSIYKSNVFRKLIFTAIFAMLIMPYDFILKAQTSKLEIEVELTMASASNSEDGQVLISVQGNEPGFIYLLYDKEPWNDGTILDKSRKMRESEYAFTNLKPGEYVVCVSDNTLHTRCKRFTIESDN